MADVLVRLNDIVDAIETAHDETSAYLDRRTGEVVTLTDEDKSAAEDDKRAARAPDFQKDPIERARLVEADDGTRFLPLPDKFDIHEWQMMADFADSLGDSHAGSSLARVVPGSGAFRRFKDVAAALQLLDQWYKFRERCFLKLAKEWCDENSLVWNDETDKAP